MTTTKRITLAILAITMAFAPNGFAQKKSKLPPAPPLPDPPGRYATVKGDKQLLLKDEGCMKDWIRASHLEGVEKAKLVADLEQFCVDHTLEDSMSRLGFGGRTFSTVRGGTRVRLMQRREVPDGVVKVGFWTIVTPGIGGSYRMRDGNEREADVGWMPESELTMEEAKPTVRSDQ